MRLTALCIDILAKNSPVQETKQARQAALVTRLSLSSRRGELGESV